MMDNKPKASPKMNANNGEPTEHIDGNLHNLPEQYDQDYFARLIKQVKAEYRLAYDNQAGKIQENLTRLKLYNNQKRDKNAVGDPLLFTVHQTVLASLYDDRLMVDMIGREAGDEETGENLTDLADYDYDLMDKDILDYFWIWDTLFFHRGLIRMYEFNRGERYKCPIPELLDPMTFLHDPDATSVNGDFMGIGAMGFGGREVKIPKYKITTEKGYFNFENLQTTSPTKSLLKDAEDYRNEAQGRQQQKIQTETVYGNNTKIPVLEWRTIDENGDKVIVWLANEHSRPIKIEKLGKADDVEWDVIDRPMYPHSHDWDGTSLPDLVEDKQRQRAVLINLGIQSVKSEMYPQYLFDESRIKNKADLVNFAFNKFIAVTGQGDVANAVKPMNKAAPRMDLVNFILETMDISAQRATATPEMQQGAVSDEKRTLGELNLVASRVDTRYSLTAKVFGWSERKFWEKWYALYKEHFKDGIDEKIIRVSSSYGHRYRPLTRENIICKVDPDIKIESSVVAANRQLKERIMMNSYAQNVMSDPNARKLYFMRKLAKLNGMDRDDIERVYPATPDEMIAEKENEQLNEDRLVQVSVNDDDLTHMEIHAKAAETKAKAAHLRAHLDSMMIKRSQPELFQTGQLNQAESVLPQDAGAQPTPNGMNPSGRGQIREQIQAATISPSKAAGAPAQ